MKIISALVCITIGLCASVAIATASFFAGVALMLWSQDQEKSDTPTPAE